MRQIYMPAIFSLFLASCLIGACAFGIDREELQQRRSNPGPSFLAAGSNHMANSFWSTGKSTIQGENRAYRGETFNSAYRDSDKKSAKQHRDSRGRSNSLYDSRNYVDEDTSQYIDIAKRIRAKDNFKYRKNSQRNNYFSRTTDINEPEGDSADTKETNKEEGDENTVTGKGVRKFYERQYQNYEPNNRQRFFERNIEDSSRSGYARRDTSYDYPFGNGFGEEQIYYYYYDPDVDSLSLGFNSHSPQNMDDHRIDDDEIMMYENDDDNSNSGVRPKKKYNKEFETTKRRFSEVSIKKIDDKKESEKQKSSEAMPETITDTDKKTTMKPRKNEKSISTTIITTTSGIEVTEGDKSNAKKHRAEDKDDVVSKTTSASFTTRLISRNTDQKNEMKKEQDKLEESLQNQVDDYQQRKPDIIPYRSSVPNPDQNETSATNESEKLENFIPQKDAQISHTTTTKPTVTQKSGAVIKGDSESGDKVKEISHDTNSSAMPILHTSTIPPAAGGNDRKYVKDTSESNSIRLQENRTDKEVSSSTETTKTKDEFTADDKSHRSGINSNAPKQITTGAASLNFFLENQTRNAQKSVDVSGDIEIPKSKAQSENFTEDINDGKTKLVLVVKDKNSTEDENNAHTKPHTKYVENNSKLHILTDPEFDSTNLAGKSEPRKQTPSEVREDIIMPQTNHSSESEKGTQNSSIISLNRKDSEDQTSEDNIGITVETMRNMTSEEIFAPSQGNAGWISTKGTILPSIKGNSSTTNDITTSTATVKPLVQENEKYRFNHTHSPPINDSPGKNIKVDSRSHVSNMVDDGTQPNKTNDSSKNGTTLVNVSEIVMTNNSAFPIDITRNKTDVEAFAKKRQQDANSKRAGKRPSKRWPVGVPYKKGINSPASISHEDDKGNVTDLVNATQKPIYTTENYAKKDRNSGPTAGVPKNDSIRSMDSQKATSGSMRELTQKGNTSHHNVEETQLPLGNTTSPITARNISSQTENTSTTETVTNTQGGSKQTQVDTMAKRFSAFLKPKSVEESRKSIPNHKEVKTSILSPSPNGTEKPTKNEQENTPSDDVSQNQKTTTPENTTQFPETSPERFNHGNESNSPFVQKESEHNINSSEAKINHLPVVEGNTTHALGKTATGQILTKSPSISNETIPISAAASAFHPDVESIDQTVNNTIVKSLPQNTDASTAMLENVTANHSQTEAKNSNMPIQKAPKAKDKQDRNTKVSSPGQTTSRPLPSVSRLQTEKILLPKSSSTPRVNNTTMNHTVTPETKLPDKNSSTLSTPVIRNVSATSGNTSAERNVIDVVSDIKVHLNKTNDAEKGNGDEQETGHLNDTHRSDDGDPKPDVVPSHMGQINDTDYVEPEIPEVSAYMIQDFSLKMADPVKEETESLQDTPVQIFSQNDTSTKDCPLTGLAEPCPSMPQPPPPPRSQAAISAVLTSHFGPTKERIIPFDLELLDLADNYDNTTGMFICTIPGTYVISVYLMSHPGAKVNARVFINDRPVAALWADDSKNAGFYPSSSIQTIVQLGFGDQVYVMLVDGGYGDSWVHANYNVFTIFLLYEQVFK